LDRRESSSSRERESSSSREIYLSSAEAVDDKDEDTTPSLAAHASTDRGAFVVKQPVNRFLINGGRFSNCSREIVSEIWSDDIKLV
jgi:hypothetical protein